MGKLFKQCINQNADEVIKQERIRTNLLSFQKESPSILVVNEEFQSKRDTGFTNEVKPEIEFKEIMYLVKHDPRLSLSEDTYVQLIMGTGLDIQINDPEVQQILNDWSREIDLERKLEDALHSAVATGNMLFEKAPMMADLKEVDITTITKAIIDTGTDIKEYIQEINSKDIPLPKKIISHFKLTNTNSEIWGRGLFHSVITPRHINGRNIDPPVISMWKIEDDMVKIFDSYASPIMMITFLDSGEDWIKQKQTDFRNMKPGAKIITDKEFKAEVFEVNPASKFDKYIEHMQQNNLEVGSQFPLQFFNGGFTARAASETTDSVLVRKVKRIQKQLAKFVKNEFFIPYLNAIGKEIEPDELQTRFDFESKSDLTVMDVEKLFEKGLLTRSEVRKHVSKNTNVKIDETDMEDNPPITSVTPTNDMTRPVQPQPVEDIPNIMSQIQELKMLISEKIPRPRGRPKKETEDLNYTLESNTSED